MRYIYLIIFLVNIITAQTIKPRIVHAHGGGGYRGGNMGLSTIDATTQMSVQVTSIAFTEASSNATSNQPQRRRENYSELKFLKDNRDKITKDISQGGGEHLNTLLDIMKLKKDSMSLAKIQSNFDVLLISDNKEFLSKLKKIYNS